VSSETDPRSAICGQRPSKNQSINRIKKKDDDYMASAAVKRVKKKLPERLAEVRGDRSQRQFARDLGVFQQNVNRYENGTTPHTDFLITLSTKENVSLDWLLLGKGRMRRGR
jgi:DNA-binding transcriptional regulator YiaG